MVSLPILCVIMGTMLKFDANADANSDIEAWLWSVNGP